MTAPSGHRVQQCFLSSYFETRRRLSRKGLFHHCNESFKMHSTASGLMTDKLSLASASRPVIGVSRLATRQAFKTVRVTHLTNPTYGRVVQIRAEKDDASSPTAEKAKTIPVDDDEEEPIWVRREKERELAKKTGGDLPFGVYLLASVIVAIAAVGSIFEYANKNPIFSVVPPDSILYTPILAVFALTGFPTSAYLFYKAVSVANKLSEEMDKMDGYK